MCRGSVPDGVTGNFHWHNPSSRTMGLRSTQPLTKMSARNISWGRKGGRCVGLTLAASCADCLETLASQPLGTLWGPGLARPVMGQLYLWYLWILKYAMFQWWKIPAGGGNRCSLLYIVDNSLCRFSRLIHLCRLWCTHSFGVTLHQPRSNYRAVVVVLSTRKAQSVRPAVTPNFRLSSYIISSWTPFHENLRAYVPSNGISGLEVNKLHFFT
jgi:hypothetical protein